LQPCQTAVLEFRAEHGIKEPIVDLGPDYCGAVYWQKEG
jgi:hypothetical protein